MLCLLIFFAFLGLLGLIFGLALYAGDPYMALYDQDYMGNRCGVGNYARKPKAFYPRIPRDMIEQHEVVKTGNFWNLRLYALCVATCPGPFDIDNPEDSIIDDYGYNPASAITQAFGSGTQDKWLSATPTIDIANRCIPKSDSSQTEVAMCAYPKCNSDAAIIVGAVCASDETFNSGEWALSACVENASGEVDPMCERQREVCMVRARHTEVMTFEMMADDDASKAMLASVANVVGGLYEIMTSIASSWIFILIGGVGLPLALAFVYMLLLFLFAKAIIWSLLVVLVISELTATFICFSRSGINFEGVSATDLMLTAQAEANVTVPSYAATALRVVESDSKWMYSVAFLLLAIISVVTIISIILARKKIAICAAIVKEATTVFSSMPLMMFFPTLATVVQLVVCAWFVATVVLLQTTKAESLDVALGKVINTSAVEAAGETLAAANVDPIAGVRELVSSWWYQNFCFLVSIYGFLTLVQWVQGIAWCTMSGATYYWYFFRLSADPNERTKTPIAQSLWRTLFYHSGSVAFAAFVIALCDMLRVVCNYIERQLGPSENMMVRLVFKVLNCVLYCLRKTVKFVSYYGLVFVSCQGLNFCMGCYRTFFFFLNNPGQVSINATVTWLLRLLAMLSMPLASAMLFYYILDDFLDPTQNAIYPALVIYVLAAVMTVSCMTVFECTITTIFVCCFQDKAEFGGKYMSENLASAFGIERKQEEPGPSSPLKKAETPQKAATPQTEQEVDTLQSL